MGVFQRIADIISANLTDLTEQFENPELMLKQVIREMETSINEVTEQTAKAMANEKTIGRELDRNRQQAAEWRDRATKAVDSGDDDLARGPCRARKNTKNWWQRWKTNWIRPRKPAACSGDNSTR